MKLFLIRIKTTNTEMLDREKIMFEIYYLPVVDSHYSSCDCHDKSHFLRVALDQYSFNNLMYVIAWT